MGFKAGASRPHAISCILLSAQVRRHGEGAYLNIKSLQPQIPEFFNLSLSQTKIWTILLQKIFNNLHPLFRFVDCLITMRISLKANDLCLRIIFCHVGSRFPGEYFISLRPMDKQYPAMILYILRIPPANAAHTIFFNDCSVIKSAIFK